ncbi:2725_t:CDS:2 [Diversispora eburnea]|uniref:2725_t:CDS:1 n=1 Tax=Diversispora eburnea TaxID=1213867 RepID=A0A9N9AHQ5_9GLOM|nr:2725_t:CDS:2 [Diversispora eburnea]
MAFQSMATGAECSTNSNPLSQFIKQFNDDLSHQKDKFIPGTERVGSGSSSFAQEFFDNSSLQRIPNKAVSDWVLDFNNVHNEFNKLKLKPSENEEMELAFKHMNMHGNWNSEFLQNPDIHDTQFTEIPIGFEEAFDQSFNWVNDFELKQRDKGKGKQKITEIDSLSWEEQFEAAQLWDIDYNKFKILELGEYEFEHDNHYLNSENPQQEGLKLMESGETLSEVALAFEAAIQKDPNNFDAWVLLGNTQAQNEKEEAAIRALQKAVELDGNNLPALMSLAVSYTNESYDQQAYLTLERWITAKYPDIVTRAAPMHNIMTTHERVTDLFLQAARNAPEGQAMDPDVQVGLGVLFYGSENYDKAVDSTLANSGRPEDAIEAYHKALELKPTFVRARFNLGVSCLNIGCYHEAAEHLLGALSMHQTGIEKSGSLKNVSTSLRDTLHRTFQMMGRNDLNEKLNNGGDVNLFRDEFEF